MDRCLVCGNAAEPTDRFCASCGASLSLANEPTGVIPLPESEAASEDLTSGLENIANGTAVLIVHKGPMEGVRFTVDSNLNNPVTIGRSTDSTIFLDDVTVSRQHAKLAFADNQWTLEDAGSLNGTYVNRARVATHVLSDRDELQVGKYRFVFVTSSDKS